MRGLTNWGGYLKMERSITTPAKETTTALIVK